MIVSPSLKTCSLVRDSLLYFNLFLQGGRFPLHKAVAPAKSCETASIIAESNTFMEHI